MDFLPIIKKTFEKTSFRSEEFESGVEKPKLINGRLVVPPSFLKAASETAFRELSFFYRESHLELLAEKLKSSAPGGNDGMVISMLLENAVSAAGGEYCLCQDSGTAVIYGWKGEGVFSGAGEREALESGAAAAYKNNFLRASIMEPSSSFFEERNTGNNLPAQIHLESVPDDKESPVYRLLFIAKGGGSSNKTSLFAMSKSILEEKAFGRFLEEKIKALGTAACPPYRLSVVVGGLSPEQNLEAQKLASSEILDSSPYFGRGTPGSGGITRDLYWEERAIDAGRKSGLGAQFGGESLLLDARVIKLPRHAASCPVSIGVSCAAHRNILVRIDKNGFAMEKLVRSPASFLEKKNFRIKAERPPENSGKAAIINLDRPMEEILKELSACKSGDRLILCGKLLLARDAAHLKWRTLLAEGKELPSYLMKHPLYYGGPAAAPSGKIIGSLGPTTAERMDPYGEELMQRGASLISLAKGNRSPSYREICKKYGAFYLGTTGGAAALLAEKCVTGNELIDYPELGMEAVRLITVRDFPAIVVIDNKGRDLFS